MNHPDIAPSATVIDKLVQYFFREFKKLDEKKREDVLMTEIVQGFIWVIPDDFDYSEWLPDEFKEIDTHLPLESIWSLYNQFKYGASSIEVPKHEEEWSGKKRTITEQKPKGDTKKPARKSLTTKK